MVHFSSLIALRIFMETHPWCTGLLEDLELSHILPRKSEPGKETYLCRSALDISASANSRGISNKLPRTDLGLAVCNAATAPLTPWPDSHGEVFPFSQQLVGTDKRLYLDWTSFQESEGKSAFVKTVTQKLTKPNAGESSRCHRKTKTTVCRISYLHISWGRQAERKWELIKGAFNWWENICFFCSCFDFVFLVVARGISFKNECLLKLVARNILYTARDCVEHHLACFFGQVS